MTPPPAALVAILACLSPNPALGQESTSPPGVESLISKSSIASVIVEEADCRGRFGELIEIPRLMEEYAGHDDGLRKVRSVRYTTTGTIREDEQWAYGSEALTYTLLRPGAEPEIRRYGIVQWGQTTNDSTGISLQSGIDPVSKVIHRRATTSDGRPLSQSELVPGSDAAPAVEITWEYDDANRLSRRTSKTNGVIHARIIVSHHSNGAIASHESFWPTGNPEWTREFDELGRLTRGRFWTETGKLLVDHTAQHPDSLTEVTTNKQDGTVCVERRTRTGTWTWSLDPVSGLLSSPTGPLESIRKSVPSKPEQYAIFDTVVGDRKTASILYEGKDHEVARSLCERNEHGHVIRESSSGDLSKNVWDLLYAPMPLENRYHYDKVGNPTEIRTLIALNATRGDLTLIPYKVVRFRIAYSDER
jgi:hypothetical protein